MCVTVAQIWLSSLCKLLPLGPNPVIQLQNSNWLQISSGTFISFQRSIAAVSATWWTSVFLRTHHRFLPACVNSVLQFLEKLGLRRHVLFLPKLNLYSTLHWVWLMFFNVCDYNYFLQYFDKWEKNSWHLNELFFLNAFLVFLFSKVYVIEWYNSKRRNPN